jgi:tRNA isopentenyl-2-thiomethyl-A-37 hydroxylase MiaE
MISVLLKTLSDFFSAKQEVDKGLAEPYLAEEAQNRFANSLESYVDERIAVFYNKQKKSASGRYSVADELSSRISSSASSVRSISALNTAPQPLDDTSDADVVKRWMKAYYSWYSNDRKNGMK